MKLEYLAEGSPDCPIIRLYDFTESEAKQFHSLVTALASTTVERVEVHRLEFVEAVDGCRLTLVNRSWDQAVFQKAKPAEFECGFTPGTWDNVACLVEPFTKGACGFQWLAGVPGEATILLSPYGQW
jgi:hypothetical protein